MLVNASLIRR